jgi:SAM-dependent methyltransferase
MSIVAEQSVAERVGFDYEAQPKETVRTCPVCGDTSHCLIECLDRYGLDLCPAMCQRCGMIYARERMTAEGYGEFYSKWYRPLVSAYSGREVDAEYIDKSSSIYAGVVADAGATFLSSPYRRTLLDVGGSTGCFARTLRKRWGYECTVLDPSPDELVLAEGSGLEAIAGFAEDFEPGDRKWDVVSLVQTVDHLLNPVAVLRKLHECLASHGVLVIDFVDYRVFSRKCHLSVSLKVDHPLYFTPVTAGCLLLRTGFEPLRCDASEDRRHLIYVCRPVPEIDAVPSSIDAARREVGI